MNSTEEDLLHKFLRLGGEIAVTYTLTIEKFTSSKYLKDINSIEFASDLLSDESVLEKSEDSDSDIINDFYTLITPEGRTLCVEVPAAEVSRHLWGYFNGKE